jgi:RNA polymerase sigma-70 factor, ECF subfamily
MSASTVTTHVSLLARLAQGADAAAWDEFSARYSDLIRSFARRQGVQANDCDDILQEVLKALLSSMPGFKYDPLKGKFRGYLKTIAVRAISRKSCQNLGMASLEQVETATKSALNDSTVEDAWETEWRQHHMRLAMKAVATEFGAKELAAFQAYAIEGHDAAEVAAEMGMSAGYVYTIKSRILKRLKELVEQQIAEEG